MLSGGQMSGCINTKYGAPGINFRTGHNNYNAILAYYTPGNEAIVLGLKNTVTSFIVKSGVDLSDKTDWQNTVIGTPSIQVKGQSLYVNGYIANGASPEYNLYVGGTSYITGNITAASFTKSGGTSSQFLKADGSVDSNSYSTTAHNHDGAYLKLSGGTMTGPIQWSISNGSGEGGWNIRTQGIQVLYASGWEGTGAPYSYATALHVSGTYWFQLCFERGGNNLHWRGGNDSTTWGWNKIWDANNFNPSNYSTTSHNHDSTYLKLSGGTITSTSTTPLVITTDKDYNYIQIKANNTAKGEIGYYHSGPGNVGMMYMQVYGPNNTYPTFGLSTDGNGYIGSNKLYHEGNLPAYPTKSSWNYDDVYVGSVSISGNYLRVYKNGSNTDLTIPYATTANSANSVAWTGISSQIHGGNEFNITNYEYSSNLLWFNYLPRNNRVDNPTELKYYYFGNNQKGFAKLISAGYIINGIDDTYVLKAGGGYKLESQLSVSYASTAGTSSSSTNATTAYRLLTNDTSQAADSCYDASPGLHFYRYNGTSSTTGQTGADGWIMQWSWGIGSVGGQIYLDDNPSKTACIRGYNNNGSGFTTWSTFLHSDNYTDYTVKKDGTGASGTWGINVTGSAGSVAWTNVSGKPSTFTPASHTHDYLPLSGGTLTGNLTATNSYIKAGGNGLQYPIRITRAYNDSVDFLIGSASSEAGSSGALNMRISNNSSGGGGEVYIDLLSGGGGVNIYPSLTVGGYGVITSSNIGSQSVNYASSAGSAGTATTSTILLTNDTSQNADACYNEAPGLRFWRYNGTSSTTGQSGGDGWILSWSWSSGSVGGQIYLDDNPTRTMCIRGRNNDTNKTFTTWATFLHTLNHTELTNSEIDTIIV